MNDQSVDAVDALQIQAQRPEVVLASLRDQLIGMAARIPSPELAVPLSYFGRLAGWVAGTVTVSERAAEHLGAIDDIRGQASELGVVRSSLGDLAVALGADGRDEVRPLTRRLLNILREAEFGDVQRVEHQTSASQVTIDDLTAYLVGRFGGDTRAVDVTVIPGGYSKTTLLVDAVVTGEPQQIVLRQVPGGGVTESLAPEYRVIASVWTPDLPIPEPLWLEEGPNALGGPFFASRRSAGSPLGTVSGAGSATIPERVIEDIAEFLATLHALDTSGIGATPVLPMRDAAEISAAVDDLVTRYTTHVGPVPPRLGAAIGWLRAHVPHTAVTSLVHGDPGFQNTLAADGRMTAALDWERAHLGDAAEDLAYVKPSVSEVFDWDTFLGVYANAGGRVPDAATMQFYTVWQDVWRHVECARLGQSFYSTANFSSAIAGYVLGPAFLDTALAEAFGCGVDA